MRFVAVLFASSLLVWGCRESSPDVQRVVQNVRTETDGPGDEASSPLPELGTIPELRLTDQRGEAFTPAALDGPWLAAFMFTRCPTVCPLITARMREVQHLAKEQQVPLKLVSFSVDPDHDTPAVLSAYAERYGVDQASWFFVTGDNVVIRSAAEQGFKVSVEGTANPAVADFGISHGSHLVLVDGQRKIRGYYRSSEPESVARIVRDARRLVNEAPASVGQR